MARHSRIAAQPTYATRAERKAAQNTPAPRTFMGMPITVGGATQDALAASSLMGSSIPKGPLSFTLAAAHGQASYDLIDDQSAAQTNMATALAGVDTISRARSIRSVSRNAEGVAPTSTALNIQAPRLQATGRGPRIVVQGMVAGDIARAVADFERYGYTINRAMTPPRLDPMTAYSYWELDDPTIVGAMPQLDRQTVAAAFERGVTVWTNVAQIGTKPANTARAGISY